MKSRAAVIGGGIGGLSVAYNLAKRGVKVTVFERGYIGQGASGRGTAGITMQQPTEKTISLAKKTVKLLGSLPKELGFNPLFKQSGYLILASDEEGQGYLERSVKLQNSLGVKSRLLTRDEISRLFSFLDDSNILCGSYCNEDGTAYPFALLYGYEYALKRLGGEVKKFTAVISVETVDDSVKGVLSDSGAMDADIVVVAAGPYSKKLVKPLGIDIPTDSVRCEISATEPLESFLDPMIRVIPQELYLTQSIRGEILGGIRLLHKEEGFSSRSSLEFLERYSKELIKIIPPLADVKILRQWAGVVDISPDDIPIFGETDIQGLYLVCGCSMNGFTYAPAIGDIMGDLIVNGNTSIDIKDFSPKRFRGH